MSIKAPIRAITSGPRFHWFGYYDKLQFDSMGRYVLAMAVDFESRPPSPDDTVALGVIDTADGDCWRNLATTSAWCWQQGCMLQWIPETPGKSRRIIWNDREGDHYVARMFDLDLEETSTLPAAVYTISADGRTALGTDFRRINHMRPGYGYAGIPDPNHDVPAPEDSGIYTVDLVTGISQQILSIAEVAALPYPHGDLSKAKHYFNHLLFNPDASRFIFLHRWRFGNSRRQTRMLTARSDGSDLHVIDDYGHMSHFIWRDTETILAWSWQPSAEHAFYLYRDCSHKVEPIGKENMPSDGHCTYLTNKDWILNDCYPKSGSRSQDLYLFHVPTGERIDLGSFHAPEEYSGEWRCDLHPRSSADGRIITIDSTHSGDGRQIYLIDIGHVIDTKE